MIRGLHMEHGVAGVHAELTEMVDGDRVPKYQVRIAMRDCLRCVDATQRAARLSTLRRAYAARSRRWSR